MAGVGNNYGALGSSTGIHEDIVLIFLGDI